MPIEQMEFLSAGALILCHTMGCPLQDAINIIPGVLAYQPGSRLKTWPVSVVASHPMVLPGFMTQSIVEPVLILASIS